MNGDEGRLAIGEAHICVVVFIGDRAYKLKRLPSPRYERADRREAVAELPVSRR